MKSLSSDSVAKFLSEHNVDYDAIECDPDFADTRNFCKHYRYELSESANVLLIASKKGEPIYAACIVLATHRLDVNKVARKKLGVSRISFASSDQTSELTGMELGGVTPFGLPNFIPIWIDAEVMNCERIILGGGNRSSKIIMSPEQLLKVPNTEIVADLGYLT